MPRPTSGTTIQRPELSALAYEHMIDAADRGFIGMRVMPIFPVPEKTADYAIIPIESLIKLPNTKRAPRAVYSRGDWEFETGTYNTVEYGWEEPVDDVEANLYRRFFDAEEVATDIAMDHILRGHEARVAAVVQNTSNAIGSANVTTEWSNAASATPKADAKAAIASMRGLSGIKPNAIIMSEKVFENVMVTAEIKNYLQYTSPHLVQTEEAQRRMLALYLGVDQVLVGNAIKDNAKKGQSASLVDLWDDEYVSFARVSSGGNRLKEPVIGRTFLWEADSPQPVVVESYREEQTRADIIRARNHVAEAIIFSGALYILGNITA
jgi:hypothetical protein